ncbi:MAG: two-component regulator propeller domain-containing protein [Microscillaceae bacterium]|nr:two-component regulator propeller domain-containing protein [Microscillaceae bacterium]
MKRFGVVFWAICLFISESSAQQFRNLTQGNVYVSQTNTIHPCESIDSDLSIRSIFIDKNNVKYLATKGQGILKLIDCDQEAQNMLKTQQSYAVGQDLSGNIWAANAGNLLVNLSQNKTIRLTISEGEAYINFIHFTQQYIWVGTLTHGLILLNPEGESANADDSLLQIIHKKLNLLSPEIYDLFVDQKNNIWLATGNGLFKITSDKKDGFFVDIVKGKVIKSIAGDEKGIWFSTLGELWNLNFETNTPQPVPLDEDLGVIEDLAFDKNHQLWIAADVVARYQRGTGLKKENLRVFDSEAGFMSRKAVCLAIDQDNAVWVGTSGSGVFKVQNDDHSLINLNSIQSFQQSGGGLNFTQEADKVDVFKVIYQTKEAFKPEDLPRLKFVLIAQDGRIYTLLGTGIPENYKSFSLFSRNFKIAEGLTLAPGKYTLEVQLEEHKIGRLEYELF